MLISSSSSSLFIFLFPPSLFLPHPPHISIDTPAIGGLEPPSPPLDPPRVVAIIANLFTVFVTIFFPIPFQLLF